MNSSRFLHPTFSFHHFFTSFAPKVHNDQSTRLGQSHTVTNVPLISNGSIQTSCMSSAAVDYRVSRLIVLCKDCGDDVGLYPSRHKCRKPERPPLPTLVVPKEEQVVTTYWEMLKSTLWSAEGSTKGKTVSFEQEWNRVPLSFSECWRS